MELALATGTAPRDWAEEDARTIATATAVLVERARQADRAARRL